MRLNPITNKYVLHNGIDIGADTGVNTLAIADGIVTEVGNEATLGLYIKYVTNNGYEVLYAHLDKILVKENEKIKQNMVIGKVGNTGNSTGSHLHYSLSKDGLSIDPIDYVSLNHLEGVVASIP